MSKEYVESYTLSYYDKDTYMCILSESVTNLEMKTCRLLSVIGWHL